VTPRCDHQPRPETCRTLEGTPADVLNNRHYPMTAQCLLCEAPIRSEQFLVGTVPPWKVIR
jgi:hypothetical protein